MAVTQAALYTAKAKLQVAKAGAAVMISWWEL